MDKLDWDVFISHASEDKDTVARPLANMLAAHGLRVWLDESELHIGDSLRVKIDSGLSLSRFGVVVLSPHFFAKKWPCSESDGLLAREVNGRNVVLPIWHNIAQEEVARQSPVLAGRVAINTREGLSAVAKSIVTAVKNSDPRDRAGAPIFAGRLTKKMFLALPAGSFMMSNIVNPDLTPKIAQVVPPLHLREMYWRNLISSGVSHSKFYVFTNETSYRAYLVVRDIAMS